MPASPRFIILALVLIAAALRAAEPALTLRGPGKTVTLTAGEFAALPHAELRAIEPHEKKERSYSGVKMADLLRQIDAPLGEKLRGPALTQGVLVRCKDGYAVLYALAEFDDNFSSRAILLCDREEGAAPPATAAPLRLIATGDKRGARWARMVSSIEIVQLAPKP